MDTTPQKYHRGDIYYANLEPHLGCEQGGIRPVLVVQNDVGNKHRNDSEYLHPFGRKQQAVFCQCHHRNPTRNAKISEQKNCSEIKKMVPLTGLEPVRSCPQRILSPRCLPFHHSGGFAYFSTRQGNRQVTDQKSAVKEVKADPDSGQRLPGSAPRTNSAPVDPWSEWPPRSAGRRCRTRCSPPSAPPGI